MSTQPDDELDGLHPAIMQTIAAHPRWRRNDAGQIVCEGESCDWVKPEGKTIKRRWQSHLGWSLRMAIAAWYYEEDLEAAS